MKIKNTVKYVALLAVVAGLAACAKVPFTQAFKNTVVKTDSLALEKIQYYIGEMIILERTTTQKPDTAAVGKVGFNNGIYTQVVQINKGTLAVCKKITPTRQVAVVGPGPNEELVFSNNGAVYMLYTNNTNKVMYGGQQFTVVKGAGAKLMVDEKTVKPSKVFTVAKGMKVSTDEKPAP